MIAIITMKIAKILYSAFKKAIAPSLTAFEISCIFWFPGSALEIRTLKTITTIKAKIGAMNKYSIIKIFDLYCI